MASNSVKLTLGFTGTDEEYTLTISDVADSIVPYVKTNIKTFNAGGAETKAAVAIENPEDSEETFALSGITAAQIITVEEVALT